MLEGHDDGAGLAGGAGQDDVAAAGGHLIDQVLMKFADRDQLPSARLSSRGDTAESG